MRIQSSSRSSSRSSSIPSSSRSSSRSLSKMFCPAGNLQEKTGRSPTTIGTMIETMIKSDDDRDDDISLFRKQSHLRGTPVSSEVRRDTGDRAQPYPAPHRWQPLPSSSEVLAEAKLKAPSPVPTNHQVLQRTDRLTQSRLTSCLQYNITHRLQAQDCPRLKIRLRICPRSLV